MSIKTEIKVRGKLRFKVKVRLIVHVKIKVKVRVIASVKIKIPQKVKFEVKVMAGLCLNRPEKFLDVFWLKSIVNSQ